MMEFASSLLKGVYPYFTVPAILVMLYLARKQQWKKEYFLLISLFFIGIFSVIIQILIADRILFVSRRYLLPFAPVLFSFAAWGICRIWDRRFKKWMQLLIPVLCVFLCIDSIMPVLKDYTSSKRRIKNNDIRQMAVVIKQQEQPPLKRTVQPLYWYEPRISSNIILKDAPAQLVWLVRGLAWSPYFPDEKFSYLVTVADREIFSEKLELLYKGRFYSLYKHKEETR